jgi:hypothetical protein
MIYLSFMQSTPNRVYVQITAYSNSQYQIRVPIVQSIAHLTIHIEICIALILKCISANIKLQLYSVACC